VINIEKLPKYVDIKFLKSKLSHFTTKNNPENNKKHRNSWKLKRANL
jgi:hypothetical protein